MDKILCDKRFVMGASLVVALYVSFMDKLTVPDMVLDIVNSSMGKIVVLVLIAYLSDKCLTLSLMLAIAFCVMITSSSNENFMDHGEEHMGEEHQEEHPEMEHEEEHQEEEHQEEEHQEEHRGEEHQGEEEQVSGMETFQNYATF